MAIFHNWSFYVTEFWIFWTYWVQKIQNAFFPIKKMKKFLLWKFSDLWGLSLGLPFYRDDIVYGPYYTYLRIFKSFSEFLIYHYLIWTTNQRLYFDLHHSGYRIFSNMTVSSTFFILGIMGLSFMMRCLFSHKSQSSCQIWNLEEIM